MQPSVPDGWRCAVLNLGSAFQVGRSRRPRRPKRVAQAILRYRCRRVGPCRPPRRRAASGVPEQVRRAPIIEGAKVGQLPALRCARAPTPLTGRCAAPKAHAWAPHARSRLAHARLTAARSRQWRSHSAPTATWPSRRRRRGEAPHSCLAPNRTAQPAHALGPLHVPSSHRRRPAQVCL